MKTPLDNVEFVVWDETGDMDEGATESAAALINHIWKTRPDIRIQTWTTARDRTVRFIKYGNVDPS